MMEDRKKFETHTLPNGITVHSHAMDVPFFSIRVVLPVGAAHANADNHGGIPGITHFLEHMIFHRSERYPEKGSFEKAIALKGGYWNAFTGPFTTTFQLDAPIDMQSEAIEGLFDHLTNPIFSEDDAVLDRGIIRNERDRMRYYPAHSEEAQYLDTLWMRNRFYSKEQLFGSDHDLDRMTIDATRLFHEWYSLKGMQVVIGGGHILEPVLDRIAAIATKEAVLTESVERADWARREFHEKSFQSVGTPIYYLGSIVPRYDFFENYALRFILELLTNGVHGPLYAWLRKEKGWTYGIHHGGSSARDRMEGWIKIPLNDREIVSVVRSEIHDRIRGALADTALVASEVSRREYSTLFFYQTLDRRLSEAVNEIKNIGRIVPEREYEEMNRRMNDILLLSGLYEKYLSTEVAGEVLLLPS